MPIQNLNVNSKFSKKKKQKKQKQQQQQKKKKQKKTTTFTYAGRSRSDCKSASSNISYWFTDESKKQSYEWVANDDKTLSWWYNSSR